MADEVVMVDEGKARESNSDESKLDKSNAGEAKNEGTSDLQSRPKSKKRHKYGWLWPLGVAATSLGGVGLLMLRGCWHRRMSWPVRVQGYSYQVCVGCGAKRLFDEKRFCSHGPFRYDLNELIAWSKEKEQELTERQAQRPAS